MRRHHGRHRVLVLQLGEPALELLAGIERILFRRGVDRQRARALVPLDIAFRPLQRLDQLPGQVLVGAVGEHRPAGEADRREGLAVRSLRHGHDAVVFRLHALGDGDERVRVLVEEGAGAAVEARDDLVEAPVDAVLRRIAVLVEVDHEGQALDPALAVEGGGAVLVEEFVGAGHGRAEHHPAVETARAAAKAIAVFARQRRDLLGGFREFVQRLRRLGNAGLGQQLLVVEHGAQVEAVGQHIGRVLDVAAKLQGARRQARRVLPFFKIRLQALQHAVIGVEREPGVGHLHDVRHLAGRDHGGELLERLAPGQRDDLDLGAGICGLEPADDGFQRFRALGAGDHLDELQRRVGKRARRHQRGEKRRSQKSFHGRSLFLDCSDVSFRSRRPSPLPDPSTGPRFPPGRHGDARTAR